MPNYTNNLKLEKPLQSENYNIDIFNSNADKIDAAIQEVKGKVDGLKLKAEKVTIVDSGNYFTSNNVEGALSELAAEINGQRLRGINIANAIIDKLEG
jgi:dihydroorotase